MLANILLVILPLATANVLWWLYRNRQAWRRMKPYSFSIRLSVVIPFSHAWESAVEPDDRSSLEAFRRGFLVNYYLLWMVPILSLLLLMTGLSYIDYREAKRDLQESQQRLEEFRKQLVQPPADQT